MTTGRITQIHERLAQQRKAQEAVARKYYHPGRVVHTVNEHTGRTLCNRSITGLSPLPTDPWARVGAEASSNGPCMRCLNVGLAVR